MKISQIYRHTIDICLRDKKIITKKIKRVAMNALIISNCCLITSLFFVASTAILSSALLVSIIGSSILIDRNYK